MFKLNFHIRIAIIASLVLLVLPGQRVFGVTISGDTINDYFMHQKNYVPGQDLNQTVKTIYIAINIWQRDDGSGNFRQIPFVEDWMFNIVEWLNHIFSSSVNPTRPIEGVDYLKDSHIRFELKTLDWYQNSAAHGVDCGAGQRLNEYVFRDDPQKRQYLNIHLTTGSCFGGSGYAIFPSARNFEEDAYVVSFIRTEPGEEEDYPFWPLIAHLAHELGHVLDLRHPYDSEFCRFDHPDFLFDLFGFEQQPWCTRPRPNCDICYHQGGWACDQENPVNTCTNNIMSGNRTLGNITPLQMGRMNRALATRNIRKYAWGYSEIPYVVKVNQQWDFNKKFYQDIRILTGTTLTITGTVEMVSLASIIIEPGATLIVENGKIANALYNTRNWKGIQTPEQERRWYQIFTKRHNPGQVILKNGAVE
jgi:hypothetical protein